MSDAPPLVCVRCGRSVEVNRELYESVFERMHWLCFHLEFEHPGDPDAGCNDPSCHVWQLEVFRAELASLGHEPDAVIRIAIARRHS